MSIPWNSILSFTGGIFILLDIGLAALLIFSLTKVFSLRPRSSASISLEEKRAFVLHDPELKKQWVKLKARSEESPPQSLTLAILEADKFIDAVLKRLGVEGEHMADRLDQLAPGDFETLDELWRAHRIRNQLAHTPDFDISRRDALEVIRSYERFLEEIGIL